MAVEVTTNPFFPKLRIGHTHDNCASKGNKHSNKAQGDPNSRIIAANQKQECQNSKFENLGTREAFRDVFQPY